MTKTAPPVPAAWSAWLITWAVSAVVVVGGMTFAADDANGLDAAMKQAEAQVARNLIDMGERGCAGAARRKELCDFLWNLPGAFESLRYQRLDTMVHGARSHRQGDGVALRRTATVPASQGDIHCRFVLRLRNGAEREFPIQVQGRMTLTASGSVSFQLDDMVPCFALNDHPFPANLPFLWMGTDGRAFRWFSDYESGRPLQTCPLKAGTVADGFFSLIGTYGIRESAEAYRLLVYEPLRATGPAPASGPAPVLRYDGDGRLERFEQKTAEGRTACAADVAWVGDRLDHIDWRFEPMPVTIRNDGFAYDVELADNGTVTERRHVVPALTTAFPPAPRAVTMRFGSDPERGVYPLSMVMLDEAREQIAEIEVCGWCADEACLAFDSADEETLQLWNDQHIIWSLAQDALYYEPSALQLSMLRTFLADSNDQRARGTADLVRIRVYGLLALKDYEGAVREMREYAGRLQQDGKWDLAVLEQEAGLRWAVRHGWERFADGLLRNLEMAYQSSNANVNLGPQVSRLLERRQIGLALHARLISFRAGSDFSASEEARLCQALCSLGDAAEDPLTVQQKALDSLAVERCRSAWPTDLQRWLHGCVDGLRRSGEPNSTGRAEALESWGQSLGLTPHEDPR